MGQIKIDIEVDHFVIRTDSSALVISPNDLLVLAERVPPLRGLAFRMLYPANTASAEPIMSLDVADFEVWPEVAESKLLLVLQLSNKRNDSVSYALSRNQAERLIGDLQRDLPKLRQIPLTRQ